MESQEVRSATITEQVGLQLCSAVIFLALPFYVCQLLAGSRSRWVCCIYTPLASRGTDCLCSGPHFQGHLYSEELWKRESFSLWSRGQAR